jgi:hypothetical protein
MELMAGDVEKAAISKQFAVSTLCRSFLGRGLTGGKEEDGALL